MFEENTATGGSMQAASDRPTPVGLQFGRVRTVAARPGDGAIETSVALTCLAPVSDGVSNPTPGCHGNQAIRQYPDQTRFVLQTGAVPDQQGSTVVRSFLRSFFTSENVPRDAAVVYAVGTIPEDYVSVLEPVLKERGGNLLRVFPASLCGSIPVFGDALEGLQRLYMNVNLGTATLDACVYRRGEQVAPYSTATISGTAVDRAVADDVETATNGRVSLDNQTARRYTERHGQFEGIDSTASGTTESGEHPHHRQIISSVRGALDEYVSAVVTTIADEFLPQLARRSIKLYKLTLSRPIVCSGAMASVPGLLEALERQLTAELQREVTLVAPSDPQTAGARGAQRIADRLLTTQCQY